MIDTKPPRGREFSLAFRFEPWLMFLFGTPIELGALALIKLISIECLPRNARYFCTTEVGKFDVRAESRDDAAWLWETSCALCGIQNGCNGISDFNSRRNTQTVSWSLFCLCTKLIFMWLHRLLCVEKLYHAQLCDKNKIIRIHGIYGIYGVIFLDYICIFQISTSTFIVMKKRN